MSAALTLCARGVGIPRRERYLQLLLGAKHVRLDRPHGAAEHVRGLLVSEILMVALHDRRALRLGQHAERALHVDAQRARARMVAVRRRDILANLLVLDRAIAIAQELLLALAR